MQGHVEVFPVVSPSEQVLFSIVSIEEDTSNTTESQVLFSEAAVDRGQPATHQFPVTQVVLLVLFFSFQVLRRFIVLEVRPPPLRLLPLLHHNCNFCLKYCRSSLFVL